MSTLHNPTLIRATDPKPGDRFVVFGQAVTVLAAHDGVVRWTNAHGARAATLAQFADMARQTIASGAEFVPVEGV